MRTTRTFTITEARAKLHQVLKLATDGDEVILVDSRRKTRYQIVVLPESLTKESKPIGLTNSGDTVGEPKDSGSY
jgi:hypothetical protein